MPTNEPIPPPPEVDPDQGADAEPLIGNTPDGEADGALRPGREQPDGFDG